MKPLIELLFLLYVSCFAVSDAACPDGSIRHGNMCYHFSHDIETWTGAKVMCEAMKSRLVEIETNEEDHFLGQQAHINNKNYWIGLSDVIEEDTWVWMNSLTRATYTQWHSTEPNGHQGENCAYMGTDGKWIDVPCRNGNYFICEKEDAVEVIGRR